MAELTGTWKIEGNDKAYYQSPYKVVFVKMPEPAEERDVQNIYEIHVYKKDTELMFLGFRKEKINGALNYYLLQISPEKYTFTMRSYGAVENDKDVLAVHCIEEVQRFEKQVLGTMTHEQFLKIRQTVVEKLSTMFDEVRGLYVSRSTPYFLMINFSPKETQRGYGLYAMYDYKNGRMNILTTQESVEQFLTRNRIELNNGKNEPLIQEKNKDLLVACIRRASVNQFRWVVSDIKGILDINFVTKDNRDEVEARLKEIEKKIKEPTISKNTLRITFLDTWFPGELENWTIEEGKGGKITIKPETLMRDVYIPSFVIADAESFEKTGHYR